MKRLIKRYVLQAQIDKESDEVNEGELGIRPRLSRVTWVVFWCRGEREWPGGWASGGHMAQVLSCVSFSYRCDNTPPKVKNWGTVHLTGEGRWEGSVYHAGEGVVWQEWGHLLYCVSAVRKQQEDVNGCAQFNLSLLFSQDSCLGNNTAHSFGVPSHITYPISNRLLPH